MPRYLSPQVHELVAHTGPGEAAVALLNCSGAGGDTPLHRAAYWGYSSLAGKVTPAARAR